MKDNSDNIYLVPGPCELYAEDFAALSSSPMPHYGDQFLEQWGAVRVGVARVLGTTRPPIGLPAVGTAATEMAASIFSGKHCIVVNTGFFAGRIAKILSTHGCKITLNELGSPYELASPAKLDHVLRENPTAAAVFAVHSESSTGILHPINALAEVTRSHGKLLAVDGVSSVGATEFCMDEWGVDIAWTTSHKALSSIPGLSFVSLSERAADFAKRHRSSIRTWFLNPNVWREYEQAWDWHPYPCTVPAPVVAVLYSYLQRVSQHDLASLFARHREVAGEYRAFMSGKGFTPLAHDPAHGSPTVSAFVPIDPKFDVGRFIADLREHFGVWVAGGIGALRDKIVRIGHMGRLLEKDRRERFFAAVHQLIRDA